MRREGAEGLLDALLVANVCKYLRENVDLRALVGGKVQSRLRHQREQADGLECHGLASGVGPRDHQRRKLFPQPHIDGHHAPAGLGSGLTQQWVAGAAQPQHTVCAHPGECAPHRLSQKRLGHGKIHLTQVLVSEADLPGLGGHLRDQLAEQPDDFLAFGDAQLADRIAEGHNRQRLHEGRSTAAGLIVEHARKLSFELLPNRDHVTVTAGGDERVLQHAGVGTADEVVEFLPDAGVRRALLAADPRQIRTRGIRNASVVGHRAPDSAFQCFECPHPARDVRQQRCALPVGKHKAFTLADHCQRIAHRQQLGRLERSADLRPAQPIADVGGAAERHVAFCTQRPCFGRLLQRTADGLHIRRRLQPSGALATRGGQRVRGHPLAYLGKLQQTQCTIIHARSPRRASRPARA